eukprot:m.429521 g.429521  ORF g.429521 m.429521 type:complete len:204 (+) comp17019_c0_seq1:582-1193(+)
MLTLALVALSTAQNSASPCTLEAEGHPTINFETLALTDQDYSVSSHQVDGYEYVANICGNLNYNDETCIEGSSVCQRHKKTAASTDVYGYIASIKLAWNDPDAVYTYNSSIVMDMTGTACGATSNTTEAKTTIVFVCSNKEFLMLQSETPKTCSVSFLFFTAQACGSPRYTCSNGVKCITTDDYSGEFGTYDACAASCNKTIA